MRRKFQRSVDLATQFPVITTVITLVLGLGLVSGVGLGVADNSDGWRTFGTSGLVPNTSDGFAGLKGYVVTEFNKSTDHSLSEFFTSTLESFYPNATSIILHAITVLTPTNSVSLYWLAWVWLAIYAWIFTKAQQILGRRLSGIVLMPLALTPWSRFFISTYAETAAFLGSSALIAGLVTIYSRRKHEQGALLASIGLLLISTSKAAFLGLLLIGAVLLAVGSIKCKIKKKTTLVVVGVSCVSLLMTLCIYQSSDRETFRGVNNHNFLMTTAIPLLDADYLSSMGVTKEMFDEAGEGFWPNVDKWGALPGWNEVIRNQGTMNSIRLRFLLSPKPLLRSVNHAIKAAGQPELKYLPSKTWSSDRDPALAIAPRIFEQISLRIVKTLLFPIRTSGALPIAYFIGQLLLFILLILLAKSHTTRATLAWIGLLSALLALAILVFAVVGDGYYELRKHVVLASYLIVIQNVSLVMSVFTFRRQNKLDNHLSCSQRNS